MNSTNYYNKMDISEKARWMSLLLAIDHIEHHCHKHELDFNEEVLKPIPIKHFIEAKASQIEHYLQTENQQKKIKNVVYNLKKTLINDLRSGVKA